MKTILIPTDYSENAHHALRFAIYISEITPLKICVFHWSEILIPTSIPQHLYKELYEQQTESRLVQLKSDTAKVLKSMELSENAKQIHYVLKDGSNLDDCLVDAVNENQVDLVIMGTHGAGGIKKMFFGSNTSRIIEKAQIPVLAVPSDYKLAPIRKIAYASDLKNVKKEVGELVKFAKVFNASIEIFHVFPSFPQWIDPSKENIEKINEELNEIYHGQKFNIHVVQTYKENDIVNGIEKFVSSFKPDVLAMFTVKRSFFDKLFDASRTEEFALSTNIPLLTLKKD